MSQTLSLCRYFTTCYKPYIIFFFLIIFYFKLLYKFIELKYNFSYAKYDHHMYLVSTLSKKKKKKEKKLCTNQELTRKEV